MKNLSLLTAFGPGRCAASMWAQEAPQEPVPNPEQLYRFQDVQLSRRHIYPVAGHQQQQPVIAGYHNFNTELRIHLGTAQVLHPGKRPWLDAMTQVIGGQQPLHRPVRLLRGPEGHHSWVHAPGPTGPSTTTVDYPGTKFNQLAEPERPSRRLRVTTAMSVNNTTPDTPVHLSTRTAACSKCCTIPGAAGGAAGDRHQQLCNRSVASTLTQKA